MGVMGQKQHRRHTHRLAESEIQTDGSLHLGFVRQTVGLYQPAPSPVGEGWGEGFGGLLRFWVQAAFKFSGSLSDGLNIGPKAV